MNKIIVCIIIAILSINIANANQFNEIDIKKEVKIVKPLLEKQTMSKKQMYYLDSNLNQRTPVVVMPFKGDLKKNQYYGLPIGIQGKNGLNEYRISIKPISARYLKSSCVIDGCKKVLTPTASMNQESAYWFLGNKNERGTNNVIYFDSFMLKRGEKEYLMLNVLPYKALGGYYTFDLVVEYRLVSERFEDKIWYKYEQVRFGMMVR